MNIELYELLIDNKEYNIQLVYRGNENILIRYSGQSEVGAQVNKEIRVPRDILEKFIQMIR
jgi:hypothetical protein